MYKDGKSNKHKIKKYSSLTVTLWGFTTGGPGSSSESGWFQCLALYTAFVGDYRNEKKKGQLFPYFAFL